jgi:hypothetical protein
MFKMLNKVYTMLSYSGRHVSSRTYIINNQNVQPICCNAFRNRNGCVSTSCKSVEPIKACKYVEQLFKCEITNKPKRKRIEDCKCEKMCIVKKSETQLIHDSSNKDNQN